MRERDRTLKSALHYCAENATVSCAEAVLGAAPELMDSRDEDGYTTLHLAVIAGNCPLVRLLLARGADVNCLDNERHSVVHWATGMRPCSTNVFPMASGLKLKQIKLGFIRTFLYNKLTFYSSKCKNVQFL